MREYSVNPSTNHTTSQVTAPAVADRERLSEPVSLPASAAATPTTASCSRPTRPIPITLPAISCHGRMVASSSSTTLLDFSSTTPWATLCPVASNARSIRMPATLPTARRCGS